MSSDRTLWPKWATEQVEIADYNPEWPLIAENLIIELKTLYPFDPDSLEHIGSTAVPGLAAKPVIDLLASVDD